MINILKLLFILTSQYIQLVTSYQSESSGYIWTCEQSGKCLRNQTIDNVIGNPEQYRLGYETQNFCRLICGRYGALFPRPTGQSVIGNQLIEFDPNKLRFDIINQSPEIFEYLREVTNIFLKNVCNECSSNGGTATVLVHLFVQSNETSLFWTTDESYALDIKTVANEVTIQISGETIYGVRHGLETLSQLIAEDRNRWVIVQSVHIKDRPTYRHRGLLIDTSRNFIPIEDLRQQLDGMAASKMNVFHWHATDSHSFPLKMPSVPQMTQYGAYESSNIYSTEDVRHLIYYAKLRGIRVLMELDAPSHAGYGWQWGPDYNLGDLAVCIGQQPWRSYCIQPPCGQLNPINENVHKILRDIFRDLINVLPAGETLHMGGDEVHFGCWNSTDQIVNFLRDHGMGRDVPDFIKLWAEFQAKSLAIWDDESNTSIGNIWDSNARDAINRKIILWSSQLTDIAHIDQYLDKNRYIIQTWVESMDPLPNALISKGYNLIMSTKNAWYFDHGFWGITKYYNWRTVYENRIPLNDGVLGGEACVWSEIIDRNTLTAKTWPRAAAVAERLWANPETSAAQAEPRFYRHNQRLVERGLATEAVAPKWCLLNEGGCS